MVIFFFYHSTRALTCCLWRWDSFSTLLAISKVRLEKALKLLPGLLSGDLADAWWPWSSLAGKHKVTAVPRVLVAPTPVVWAFPFQTYKIYGWKRLWTNSVLTEPPACLETRILHRDLHNSCASYMVLSQKQNFWVIYFESMGTRTVSTGTGGFQECVLRGKSRWLCSAMKWPWKSFTSAIPY